jgi:ATP-dependent helicase HrpA
LAGKEAEGLAFEEAFVDWLNATKSPSDQLIRLSDFNLAELPDLYQPVYQLVNEKGKVLEQSGDLKTLLKKHDAQIQAAQASSLSSDFERKNLTDWPADLTLPASMQLEQYGQSMCVYPALSAQKNQVDVKLFSSEAEAEAAHSQGVFKLLEKCLTAQMNRQMKSLALKQETCLQHQRLGSCEQLKQACFLSGLKALLPQPAVLRNLRDASAFEALNAQVRGELFEATQSTLESVARLLALYQPLAKKLYGPVNMRLINALADMKSQLDALIYPGFAADYDAQGLRDVHRYLKGLERRLERLENDPAKDQRLQVEVRPLWEAYLNLTQPLKPEAQSVRWMIEELRISLFAPELKTKYPVSGKKIKQQMQGLA